MRDTRVEWLSPEDVAAALQIHVETVRVMCREKRMPGRKFGHSWRIPSSVLEPEKPEPVGERLFSPPNSRSRAQRGRRAA